MEKDNIYIYTIKDLQDNLNKARTTIISMINKLDLTETEYYFKKVKENNRDKVYYTQKMLDLLKVNNTNAKTNNANTTNKVNTNTSLDLRVIDLLEKQIQILNEQLKNKDIEIQQLHHLLALKEQSNYESNKNNLLDDTNAEDREKKGFFRRLFNI